MPNPNRGWDTGFWLSIICILAAIMVVTFWLWGN